MDGMMQDKYIRFYWAIKRLLRQKANFAVLESFLSELLGEKVVIKRMLESEGNKETPDDKFNRVDVLAENSNGELIIIEIQNNAEIYYFQRMLYGTSKAIHLRGRRVFPGAKGVLHQHRLLRHRSGQRLHLSRKVGIQGGAHGRHPAALRKAAGEVHEA